MTVELADFLLARIAEDEAVAAQPLPRDWRYEPYSRREAELGIVRAATGGRVRGICEDWQGPAFRPVSAHIARWDPARVLAECEAKRAIIGSRQSFDAAGAAAAKLDVKLTASGAVAGLDVALKFLALPYADHPDYRQEWRV